MIDRYFGELGYKNDGFHSNIIFEGESYIIEYNDATIGFFSLGSSGDGRKMFRTFFVLPEYRKLMKNITHFWFRRLCFLNSLGNCSVMLEHRRFI